LEISKDIKTKEKQMNINDLTLGQLKEIKNMINNCEITSTQSEHQPYMIGKNMLIRTVTMILVGKVIEVGPQEIILEGASWVADTARFSEALQTGNVNENEPYPDGRVTVGRGAVIDACEWKHDLLREVK
jgi:hypothetical protein